MTNFLSLEDIMFEHEALGLAEELKDIDPPFAASVASDEAAEIGKTVFFRAAAAGGRCGRSQSAGAFL